VLYRTFKFLDELGSRNDNIISRDRFGSHFSKYSSYTVPLGFLQYQDRKGSRIFEFAFGLSQTSSVDIFEMTAIQVTMNIFNDIITTLIEGYRIRRTNLRDVFGGLI
jgi:hypothetical protein